MRELVESIFELPMTEEERLRIELIRAGVRVGDRKGRPSPYQLKREYYARREYGQRLINDMANRDYSMAVSAAKCLGLRVPPRPQVKTPEPKKGLASRIMDILFR